MPKSIPAMAKRKIFKNILVPVDLTDLSPDVIKSATSLAEFTGAKLTLLNAVDLSSFADQVMPENINLLTLRSDIIEASEKELKDLAKKLKVPNKTLLRIGTPAVAIRQATRDEKTDLVFMSNHGENAFLRFFAGSVTDAVAREAIQPVWIQKGPFKPIKHILVPLDGSRHSLKAFALALDLAREFKAKVSVVSVVERDVVPSFSYIDATEYFKDLVTKRQKTLADWIKMAKGQKLAQTKVFMGNPRKDLAKLAKKWDCDLIVMSSHGKTGIGFQVLGRVAASTIHHAHCSVLMDHPE